MAKSAGRCRIAFFRWLAVASICSQQLLLRRALACPVCFSQANQGVLEAYYLTAALMTLLPLLIVGCIGAWLHRRQRASLEAAQGR
jgi:hypothetical protein